MNYPDNELTYYLHDNTEEAQDILYDKYKYIIEVLISKYRRVFLALNMDMDEIKQEANLAFSYAIYNYDCDKDASLSTFINLCVERKIRAVIRKYETNKNKAFSDSLSFDSTISDGDVLLESIIGDDKYEPLKNLENIDTLKYINNEVKNILSSGELEVYNLLKDGFDYNEIANILNKKPKQVDNAIQRIRSKLRSLDKNLI